MRRRPPRSTLFPSTALFRSGTSLPPVARGARPATATTPADPAAIREAIPRGRRDRRARGTPRRARVPWPRRAPPPARSEEHTSELQSQSNLVCRLLLETPYI